MKTVKVVRMIGGTRHEIEIPLGKARELGISAGPAQPLSIAYLMDGLFVSPDGDRGQVVCSSCGTTIRDVILRHHVGCSHCYDTFSETIDRLLRIHRTGSGHPDRIPARLQRYRRLFMEREDLLNRLNSAVESEDFEAAAGLRDEIRLMEHDSDEQ